MNHFTAPRPQECDALAMSSSPHHNDARVAVLVDCENSQPDILDYALKMAAQFGRVVLLTGPVQ